MSILTAALGLVLSLGTATAASSGAARSGDTLPPAAGTWRAWLESPGGAIPFGLELSTTEGGHAAWILNGEERHPVARVELDDGELVLHLDPYDSRVRARVTDGGRGLTGEWERYRGPDRWTRMPFHATAGAQARFPQQPPAGAAALDAVAGRWSVEFSESDDTAVAVFAALPEVTGSKEGEAGLVGTFLTTLGDYRFLEGGFDGETLSLSCFDGAHAFLFRAQLTSEGTLSGDFWSRDTWHETWTAERDAEAALADPFGLTSWTGSRSLGELAFPDVEGEVRSLDDPAFAGRARILVLFGTWCPNCYDASTYLRELHARYGERGLSVLGLAFEFGDTFERNAEIVRRYAEHKGVDYPILIAGPSDKKEASRAFPLLDRVRAYPTFVFLDAAGKPRAVYTGFSGPATGPAHERLREQFERTIEELLGTK